MFYATCAYPGCYKKIVYDYGCDGVIRRPRYCPDHMEHLGKRSKDTDWLFATTKPLLVSSEVVPIQTEPMVIMRCPLCKTTTTIPKSNWSTHIPCIMPDCSGKMIYHKDTNDHCYD